MNMAPSKMPEVTQYILFSDITSALKRYYEDGVEDELYSKDELTLLSALMDTFCIWNEISRRRIIENEGELWKR